MMTLEEIIPGFIQHPAKNKIDYNNPDTQSFFVYFPRIIPQKGPGNFFKAQGCIDYGAIAHKFIVWATLLKEIKTLSVKEKTRELTETKYSVLIGPKVYGKAEAYDHTERLRFGLTDLFNTERIENRPTQSLIDELITLTLDIDIQERGLSLEKRERFRDKKLISSYIIHLNESRYRVSEIAPLLEFRLGRGSIFPFVNYFLSKDTSPKVKDRWIIERYKAYLMTLHGSKYTLAEKLGNEIRNLIDIPKNE